MVKDVFSIISNDGPNTLIDEFKYSSSGDAVKPLLNVNVLQHANQLSEIPNGRVMDTFHEVNKA